jgi:hypothetical protein
MGRSKAAFTLPSICRILKSSRRTGIPVHLTHPGGTVVEVIVPGEGVAAANDNMPNDVEGVE